MQTGANKLMELAKAVRDWQTARGLSDSELLRKFAGLGSTKTYKRILDGDMAELDLERWETDFAQVWALIELESQSSADNEPIYDDLKHMTLTRLAAQDAMSERGNNRLVIVEGPSGCGKTTAGRHLAGKYGRKVVFAEADETWKDSVNSMLGGLLRALGIRQVPPSADERKTRLLAALKESPVCVVIDEAHHLGPKTLNMVKTLLNQTSCQFVFLCIETLFRKLECAAYEEAKQLTKNRLCERVRPNGPSAGDVEKFLDRRLKWEADTLKPCAALLAERAARYGYWNFVNLAARQCRRLAGKEAIDQDTFIKGMNQAAGSR